MANITAVNEFKNGQMIVTIPKAFAEALRLEHKSKVEWLLVHGDVVVRKV